MNTQCHAPTGQTPPTISCTWFNAFVSNSQHKHFHFGPDSQTYNHRQTYQSTPLKETASIKNTTAKAVDQPANKRSYAAVSSKKKHGSTFALPLCFDPIKFMYLNFSASPLDFLHLNDFSKSKKWTPQTSVKHYTFFNEFRERCTHR